ncbi:hypothetical protein Nepgr_016345 [Nepenthes gracilis]|uniref:Uncharacterized protein n=1 Tax=Nepenthes gracilis TaxID=150966 RepID=A0AAD3XRZ6_NEPGR|nr:hypothetical protein Nepgr_016345 [Nepenthes gracilis]
MKIGLLLISVKDHVEKKVVAPCDHAAVQIDAEIIEEVPASRPTPSLGNAGVAVCDQNGLLPVSASDPVGLSDAGADSVSLRPVAIEGRMEAYGPEVAAIRLNLPAAGIDVAAVAHVPSVLAPELGCVGGNAADLCGPEPVALLSNVEIPSKPGSVLVPPVELTSNALVSACGYKLVDYDVTPELINQLTRKYSLANPVQVEPTSVGPWSPQDGDQQGEVLETIGKSLPPLDPVVYDPDNCFMVETSLSGEDEADEADPMFQAIQSLLDADASQQLFEGLHPEHQDLILDFLNRCWFLCGVANSTLMQQVVDMLSAGMLVDALDLMLLLLWGWAVLLICSASKTSPMRHDQRGTAEDCPHVSSELDGVAPGAVGRCYSVYVIGSCGRIQACWWSWLLLLKLVVDLPIFTLILQPVAAYQGVGQETSDDDQVLTAADPLPISLLSEIEDPVSWPIVVAAAGPSDELKACLGQLDPIPCVLSANSESQPLSVTSRESPELLDLLHIEGQHIPSCAGEVLEVVPSGLPSESTAEDAPTVDSTPTPHAVQQAPDDDSACRIAADIERLRKQLMEIKEQRRLDLQLPCCTPAARKSSLDGSYLGSEDAVQGMSLRGANASPSCHQGPPARWADEELFARQALNGRFPKAR